MLATEFGILTRLLRVHVCWSAFGGVSVPATLRNLVTRYCLALAMETVPS